MLLQGARDYLSKKNFDGVRLHWTIQNAVGSTRMRRKLLFSRNVLETVSSQLDERNLEQSVRRDVESRFLSHLSHELRTPVVGIIGNARRLEHSGLNREQSEFISTLLSCGGTLLALIEDLLTLASLNPSESEPLMEEFSLSALAKDAVTTVHSAAHAKGLTLHSEVRGELPDRLMGPSTRIGSVLVSLLGNAVKFTDHGKISLLIEGRPKNDSGWTVDFSVHDQGQGIKPEEIPGLFQGLEARDSSFSRSTGGLGLGLALCRQLVERMGSAIRVESNPPEGSVFRFSLELEAVRDVFGNGTLPALSSHNIMVVEDNPVVLQIVKSQLEKLGQNVRSAKDGLECLKLIEQQRFDLIFMDCQMPGLDGYRATEQLRLFESEFRGGLHTPVVALTAHALPQERERCLACGMDDFLTKPASDLQLHSAISRWIER